MKHDYIIFFSKSDQFAVEAVRRHSRGRVVRIGDNHQSGLHRHFLGNLAQIYNVMIFFFLRHIVQGRACQRRAVRKYRIAGIRNQYPVALVHNRQGNMGQALLGAQKRTDFRLRVKLHTVTVFVPPGYRI